MGMDPKAPSPSRNEKDVIPGPCIPFPREGRKSQAGSRDLLRWLLPYLSYSLLRRRRRRVHSPRGVFPHAGALGGRGHGQEPECGDWTNINNK